MIQFLIFLLVGAQINASADSIPQVTVCDAIAKRSAYDGKVVAVRGRVAGGGHGISLVADGTCPYRLITRGVAWPTEIDLTIADKRFPLGEDSPVERDMKAIRRRVEDLRKADYHYDTDLEITTFVGLFATYPDPELERRANADLPGALRLGFGPPGLGAPAQLVYWALKDVTVIKGGREHP